MITTLLQNIELFEFCKDVMPPNSELVVVRTMSCISCGKYPVKDSKDHVFCPSVHRSMAFNQGYLHGCKSPSTATCHASWIFASRCKIPWFFCWRTSYQYLKVHEILNKLPMQEQEWSQAAKSNSHAISSPVFVWNCRLDCFADVQIWER